MTELSNPTLNALRKRIMLDDNLWENGRPRGEAINTIVAMIDDADAATPELVATPEAEACRRCGGPNPSWSAPSPLWNKVMRGNDINGAPLFDDLVCIPCFITLAALNGSWYLTVDPLPDDLVYTTPSGRVWDDAERLWVERERVDARAEAAAGRAARVLWARWNPQGPGWLGTSVENRRDVLDDARAAISAALREDHSQEVL